MRPKLVDTNQLKLTRQPLSLNHVLMPVQSYLVRSESTIEVTNRLQHMSSYIYAILGHQAQNVIYTYTKRYLNST